MRQRWGAGAEGARPGARAGEARIGSASLLRLLRVAAAAACLAICGASPSYAGASVNIEAEVDRARITLNEDVTLTVRVSAEGLRSLPSPELPALEDFEIAGSSTSSSVTVVNRQVMATETRKYVLSPLQTGSLTIDPIVVRYGGEKYSTEPITITVEQGTSQPTQRPRTGTLRKKPQYLPSGGRGDVFVTLEADRSEAYVGEQITLTFTFYRRVSLWEEPAYTAPPTPGFWVEEMPKPRSRRGVVGGREYFIEQVQYALFPTAAGETTVGPAALEAVPDPFARPVQLKTETVELRVLPLPEEEVPSGFTGAVGSFAMSQEAGQTEVNEGEPLTLRVTVSGRGNLKTVPDLLVPEPKEFKVYTSKVQEDYRFAEGVLNSKKTFEYVFIPKRRGEQEIESIAFPYFDPTDRAYHTVKTEPVAVIVRPGAVADRQTPGPTPQQEIKALGEDIRFIKTGRFNATSKYPYIHQNPAFMAAQVLPLLAVVVALVYRRHRERQQAESTVLRSKRAKATSLKRLKKARKLMSPDAKEQFYTELSRALSRYLEDKLNVPASHLTKAAIATKLTEKGLPDGEVDDIQRRLAACDFVRFAPVSPTLEEMEEAYHFVEDGILALEKNLR